MNNLGYTPNQIPSAGLLSAVRNILAYHVGRQRAISRADFLKVANAHVPNTTDRQLRLAINYLRHQGELILSTGGIDGGYWLAANPDEAHEFIDAECLARAYDLMEQANAMRSSIERTWPPTLQPSLF